MSNKKCTLLEKAKGFQKKKRPNAVIITNDLIELSLAWVNDEITLRQFAHAIDGAVGIHTYTVIANALKEYIKKT
jgi:hypothetical protein